MSDIFISYARSTAAQAQAIAKALRALGYGVWLDDELPAHRPYADVIDERLRSARAVVVIWSAEAVRSQWVRSESDRARLESKLVQLNVDGTALPMPFDQIQCADLTGWRGDIEAPGWRKVVASVADLAGAAPSATAKTSIATAPATVAEPPLPLPTKPSIAVMPFANLSGDPEQEYFVDGVVSEITNALSRFKEIFVIASGSTLSFKGKSVSPQDAARQLGVSYLLLGSVRKAANRVRIAVQLIEPMDGRQIWTDRFDDTLDDVFALQDKVALSVAARIVPTVRAAEISRMSARPTHNIGAHDLVLRAGSLIATQTNENIAAAISLLERAMELDPNYARPLSTLAYCLSLQFSVAWTDDRPGLRNRAIGLIHRALSLAPDDAEVLSGAAIVLLLTALGSGDVAAATSLIDRALDINPGLAGGWAASGWVHFYSGQLDTAADHFEKSLRLNPLAPDRHRILNGLGQVRMAQRRLSEAVALLRQSAELASEMNDTYVWLAVCYAHLGQLEEAKLALQRFETANRTTVEKTGMRLTGFVRKGLALTRGSLTTQS